jgi:serine/threonine protein phosphatase 1
VVVYLGDYVDRGPDSKSLINYLIEFPLPDFEVYHLKGNHECAFMDFLDANLDLPSWSPRRIPKGLASWLLNGGGSTLASYGIALAPDANQRAVVDAIGQLQKAIPDRHQAFLSSLILSHVEGDYHFVHAGVRPGVDWAEQDDHDLCWIREEFLETDEDFGYCVVHGHTIAEEPIVRRNRIGIDTGASQSGRLTCVVLEENKYHFIQT